MVIDVWTILSQQTFKVIFSLKWFFANDAAMLTRTVIMVSLSSNPRTKLLRVYLLQKIYSKISGVAPERKHPFCKYFVKRKIP